MTVTKPIKPYTSYEDLREMLADERRRANVMTLAATILAIVAIVAVFTR
jgi:hypothetical protein